MQLLADRTATQ